SWEKVVFMSIESWIIGIFCAFVGGFSGHYFTQRAYETRVKKLEQAFYNEFAYMLEQLEKWMPTLLSEYEKPLADSYSGSPVLDLSMVDALVIELAGTYKICPPEQRKLIIRLRGVFESIKVKDSKRDVYINRLLTERVISPEDKREIASYIAYYSAALVAEVIPVIFFMSKLSVEQERFSISEQHTNLDYAKVACARINLEFDGGFWLSLYRRVGLDAEA
ncbi:hypothetical protein, partial [Vibrio vulnificus]|uniref:hypothetical protein n=2 Tax=Vibrio TaxID=662 RepID=UPI001A8C72F2